MIKAVSPSYPHISFFLLSLWVFFASGAALGREFYVAVDGNDNNDGTINNPFQTIGKGVEEAQAGDFIFIRGGVHYYSEPISISKDGEDANVITLQSYAGEDVILDFSAEPFGSSYRGINLSGDYWHLKGFTIQWAGDNGLNVKGSHNIVERLVTRYNSDSGLQLHGSDPPAVAASYNQVIDCDSYENYDAPNHGENADGFAAKFSLGPNNVFINCRSWSNSDDGWDFWEAGSGVTLVGCWSFYNGENIWGDGDFQGDGNGYKLGHGSGAHILKGCVAYYNEQHGIDLNGNETGVTIYNCSCVDNDGYNYCFDEHSDVHVMRNNLSYLGSVNIYDEIDDEYNSWNGFTVTSGDFVSLNPDGLAGAREADGGLPGLAFVRLSPDSLLIDAGIDVGLPFEEYAPDLGAFEYIPGDCYCDGDIDSYDLDCFSSNWLDVDCGICNGADFDGSEDVDFYDFACLAANWLEY